MSTELQNQGCPADVFLLEPFRLAMRECQLR